MEQVQEERCQDVITVMTERNFGRTNFLRETIQRATAQTRTYGTVSLAFRRQLLGNAVSVFFQDVIRNVIFFKITW